MKRLIDTSEPEKLPNTAPSTAWEYNFVAFGQAGLDKSGEQGLLDDAQLAAGVNLALDYRLLRSDFGYQPFADVSVPVNFSKVRAFYLFIRGNARQLMAITNFAVFRFDEGNSQWISIGDQTLTLAAGFSAGATLIDLTTNVALDRYVAVQLNDTTWFTTKVAEVNVGGVTNRYRVAPAFPGAADSTNHAVRVAHLNGVDSEQVVVTAMSGPGEMYFTNNSDRPKRYNGALCLDIDGIPFTNFRCRSLVTHYNILMLLNTVEDGTAWPQRSRWCDIGAPNVWPVESWRDLLETPEEIVTAQPLNKDIIIYKRASIFRVEYTGNIDQVWDFTKVIDDEGLVSPLAVTKLVNAHAFLGDRNFYLYDGGYALTPVGAPVFDFIQGPRQNALPESLADCFSVYSPVSKEIWWFLEVTDIPELDSMWDDGTPWDDGKGWDPLPDVQYKTAFRYKVNADSWTLRLFPLSVSAVLNGRFSNDLTYNTAYMQYNATNFSYAGGLSNNYELLVFSDGSDGLVYKYDFLGNTDSGTVIPWSFETRDFYYSHYKIRLNRFDFTIGGGLCYVYYSTDKGQTWTVLGNAISATDRIRTVQMYKQFVCRQVRFRFEGVDLLELEHFGFSWRRESLY